LKRVPLLLLRGENSDLLSAETLDAMARVHPSLEAITVPGQGHAPLLLGDDLLGRSGPSSSGWRRTDDPFGLSRCFSSPLRGGVGGGGGSTW